MKVLGISGSPRIGQTTERLIREILDSTGLDSEFISLAGKRLAPCCACSGCIDDNICKINDDMQELREKIIVSDAYVIGAPVYFSTFNALTHCFLERFYQFRHRSCGVFTGKLGIAVGSGALGGDEAVKIIESFFLYNRIECLGSLSVQGPACCFSCRNTETCSESVVNMFFGSSTKVTPEIIPDLTKQSDKVEDARNLGRALRLRLGNKHKTN